jgi:GT2 family glycosyltransferase
VIVVTYESRRFFDPLRQALEAQTAPFDLIVVDNASSPGQRPLAADFPNARIIQNARNVGFARANNDAATLTEAEFIVLLNPDAFPEPDWLQRLIAVADAHPSAASVGSTQLSAEDQTRYDGLGDCYHVAGVPWRGGFGLLRADWQAVLGRSFSACAAAALYRKTVWQALGGFDERFFCYCEDVDLGFRIRLAGGDVLQAPEAIVRHVGEASSGKRSPFAVFHGARNRTWTFVKNMPSPLFELFLPAHVAITLAFLAISLFRGTGASTWRGVAAALRGIGPILRERRRIQAARVVAIGDLLRVMTISPWKMARRVPIVVPIEPDARLFAVGMVGKST